MKRLAFAAVTLAAASATPLAAQRNIDDVCTMMRAEQGVRCRAVALAADAAQPQVGILMAGGNPTLGTASTGGVRLGILPRVNVVLVRVPDIREESAFGTPGTERFSVPAPALGGDVAVGLFPGLSVAPTVGGIGAVDLLGSATVLPASLAGAEWLEKNPVSWGAGARVGLLRESFTTPGVSVSVMYRKMSELQLGDVCEGAEVQQSFGSTCVGDGNFGQVNFALENVSVRGAVSKRLLGLGLTAGVGYDRFTSDADLAIRTSAGTGTTPVGIRRFTDVEVENDRWSAFVNGSFTLLVGSIVAEAGWMQGQDPVTSFDESGDFDPRDGAFFGSVGARLSL